MTLALAVVAGIPTARIGGTDELLMMGLGAGVALVSVLGGYFIAQMAFRGPDRFASKLVLGGFLIRLVLLALTMTVIVTVTRIPLSRFVLWLVAFYFVLLMAEAWILARESTSAHREGTTR
jgi:hypothetical protein